MAILLENRGNLPQRGQKYSNVSWHNSQVRAAPRISFSNAAMKNAVEALTRYMAKEWGPRKIAGLTALCCAGLSDDIGGDAQAILFDDVG